MGRTKKTIAASSRAVPRVLRVLRARGADVDALVRELGLAPDAEAAEEAALAPEDFELVLRTAATQLGDPLLAVRLPELLEWPSYHIGELAARASPTLREAFARVARYAPLFYEHLACACEERAGELVVSQRLRSGRPAGRYGNEYAVASMLTNARRIVGASIVPRRIFFAHAPIDEVDALRGHFGVDDIAFDRDASGLVFDARDVERPSIAHDPRLLATAEQLAERALKERPPPGDFVGAVTARVRQSLRAGSLDAGMIARKMHLSTRTLQRRLDEHGMTFTALVERVRRDAALEAARDPSLTLVEVAERAGFSDAATFGRAFKRWTGQSPGAYRAAAAAAAYVSDDAVTPARKAPRRATRAAGRRGAGPSPR
jgi:AraC-like DNA-binding protein